MTPTLLPSLADAITAAEQAENDLQVAFVQTTNDQALASAAQAKADAAKQVVAQDQSAQTAKQAADVAALQTLDAVIQARILALTPPTPAP